MLVRKYGAGKKTVILVHGGPSLYGYMETLGKELQDDFIVVDYAQRGTFNSPVHGPITVNTHLDDLLEIVKENAKGSKAIIIGHSWGANVALLAAAESSDDIEKLILIGTSALKDELSDKHQDSLNSRYTDAVKRKLSEIQNQLEKELTIDEVNEVMELRLSLTSPFYHLDSKVEELLPELKWNFKTFRQSIDSLWDLIDSGNIPSILKRIKVPVIAYQGDSDPFPYKETFEFLSENILNIKTYKIENSGHFPWLEPTSRYQFLSLLRDELKNRKY